MTKFFTGQGKDVSVEIEALMAENERLKLEIGKLNVIKLKNEDQKEVKKMTELVVDRPGRKCSKTEVSRDDELKTVKGVPKRAAEELTRTVGSDPV